MNKEKVIISKQKGNSKLIKERKQVLETMKQKYGKWFAYWLSFQNDDIKVK